MKVWTLIIFLKLVRLGSEGGIYVTFEDMKEGPMRLNARPSLRAFILKSFLFSWEGWGVVIIQKFEKIEETSEIVFNESL